MPGGCGTPIDPSHELRASPTHAGGTLRLRNAGKGWMGESGEEIVATVGRWGKCLTETSTILSTDQQRNLFGQHPRIIPSLYIQHKVSQKCDRQGHHHQTWGGP